MKITGVTLSGLDDLNQSVSAMRLSKEYKFLEWAILRSKSREGAEPRYPAAWFVNNLMHDLFNVGNLAVHLCGSFARESLEGPFFWAILYPDEFCRADRVQVNAPVELTPSGLSHVITIAKRLGKVFILQTSLDYMQWGLGVGEEDCKAEDYGACWDGYEKRYIHFLVDASRGQGRVIDLSQITDEVMGKMHGHHIGFAGGIGPDNVRQVLEHLAAIKSDSTCWVDMESKIRSDDKLDLDKCREVLKVAKEFIR
jgi:hypothetical protein